jgi:hypothetical protein
VLAASLDTIDPPSSDRPVVVNAVEFGKDRIEAGYRAARERPVERASRTEDSVPFRHLGKFQISTGALFRLVSLGFGFRDLGSRIDLLVSHIVPVVVRRGAVGIDVELVYIAQIFAAYRLVITAIPS